MVRGEIPLQHRELACYTATELIGVKNLLGELGFTLDEPLPMHCDDQ